MPNFQPTRSLVNHNLCLIYDPDDNVITMLGCQRAVLWVSREAHRSYVIRPHQFPVEEPQQTPLFILELTAPTTLVSLVAEQILRTTTKNGEQSYRASSSPTRYAFKHLPGRNLN